MPMTIEQQGQKGKRVVLDGRALPLASSVEWGGEQRADITYLPGSPEAVGQIFGPKELPMSPEGRWGDRYMAGEGASCLVEIDGVQITSAIEAAQAVDAIRREGRLLRVAYESEVRYGLLMEFRYRPFAEGRTLERIDWSMKFEWLSRENRALSPSIPNRVGVQNFASRLSVLAQQVQDKFQGLLGKSDAILAACSGAVGRVRSISDTANQAATSLTQRASDAASIAQSVIGLTAELSAASLELVAATSSTAVSAAVGLQAAGDRTKKLGDLKLETDIGAELVLVNQEEDLRILCRQLADLADQIDASAQLALVDVQPYVVYSMRGESLREIALRELGSSSSWRDIAVLNGLSGSEVYPGLPLLIPRQKQANTSA